MIVSICTSGDSLTLDPCHDANALVAGIIAEIPSDGPVSFSGGLTEWNAGAELVNALFLLHGEAFRDTDHEAYADRAAAFIRSGLESLPVWIAFMTVVLESDRAGPVEIGIGDRLVVLHYDGGVMHTRLREGDRTLGSVGYVASPVLLNWFYGNGTDERLAA